MEVSASDFAANRVTNPGQSEIIRQRLYDFQLMNGAGAQRIAFFQLSIGQGITTALGATVGSTKSIADTNLEIGGTLPSGRSYLCESIEVLYLPGSVSTANTYTPATIGGFIAVAAATTWGYSNDINTFYQSGVLELNILSKNYLRETPLMSFPPKASLDFSGAVTTNSATTAQLTAQVAKATGRPYYIEPRVTLQPAVNFEVALIWPAAVAAPSGFNGRVGVYLDGYMMRASQ
jgi:hypothetical protein